ncbi:hypothetical protein HN011_010529 [Eciton burchellii]|jgi:hypothetical protein|nr:hypothetical protein HN011_010529 [Eciton burchellii]
MHTSTDFVLRGGCGAFADRQKLLFDQLLIAESKCNKRDSSDMNDSEVEMNEYERNLVCTDNPKQKRQTKRFRGKESIFNRPQGPAPRAKCKVIPDYHKNPHKWVKYSLDDVSNEDMTDRSNTQAAMSFLRELKERKKKEEVNQHQKMDIESCKKQHTSTSQMIFKKPQVTERIENSEAVIIKSDDRPMFKSSKIILPEYQVGLKPKKVCRRNQPVIKVDRSKELKLDHLQQLDEEDE